MWTLELMREFVIHHRVDVQCKSCAGSFRHGRLYFKACLIIYPDWDEEALEDTARVGCDVMLDSKSCLCQLTTEEFDWGRKEAHRILNEKLGVFLREHSAPAPEPLVEHQLEESYGV